MKPGLALMPFQDKGSDLLAASARAMLVWDPGVGKTPTAVRASVKAKAGRVLVFCPPIAVSVWRNHFRDWGDDALPVMVYDTSASFSPYKFVVPPGVKIVPYSRITERSPIIPALLRDTYDVVIIDEAHYLKNPEAIRTKGVYGPKIDLLKTPLVTARHVWCLTGTPVLNHAAEFWTHLHALKPDAIILPQLGVMDIDTFVRRFCVTRTTTYGSPRIIGSKNTHELAERIRGFSHRKTLKEAMPDMPELRIVDHPLPDTDVDPNLRAEMARALIKLKLDPETMTDDELLAEIQAGNVAFSTVRRLIGRAKINAVAKLTEDFLGDNEDAKLILFAHHREVIEALAYKLHAHSPLVIHGDTPLRARDTYIEQFQINPARRLIILAIEAAGEVITLHAAHNVFITEPSPVPNKNYQAICRAYRNGQRNAVLARFLLLSGTLDARLMEIVARKTRDIAKIVDGKASKPLTAPIFPATA